jgi:glycosyltransferase involved in cell wall biosynthesis
MQHRRILCITLEPLSTRMAGPAIRCFELGKQLAAAGFAVTVASPCLVDDALAAPEQANLRLESGISKSELIKIAADFDILFVQANVLKPMPGLAQLGKYLIVDLYDPYLFSLLAQYSDDQATAWSSYRLMHQVLEKHMLAADFTVCASEKQRDYWLGRFCALGRLNPLVYKIDPTLRKVIDVVPFGLSATPPVHSKQAIKGVIPGIGVDDKVLLWSGGLWDWFDPLTIIEAMSQVVEQRADVKLLFMGLKSPNPQVPMMPMVKRAQDLAEQKGLTNRAVFFFDQWVKYEDRANYLIEADAAVSAHFDTIETRFSFRTRILDNFWTGLPIITTGGDPLAELIEKRSAGLTLGYQDVTGWSCAILKMVEDTSFNKACRAACQELAQEFVWQQAAAALLQYCQNPNRLPPHQKVTMPTFFERVHAVYSRGGKDLFLKRSREILSDLLK